MLPRHLADGGNQPQFGVDGVPSRILQANGVAAAGRSGSNLYPVRTPDWTRPDLARTRPKLCATRPKTTGHVVILLCYRGSRPGIIAHAFGYGKYFPS